MRYTINTQNSRPDSALVNRFAHLAVPDICDALGRNAALPSSLKPLNCTRILGIAYTVNLPASENLLLYYAAEKAQPGDVIVASCAGYTERAVTGDVMASYCMKRGLAGFVIDGAVRDLAGLRALDFPVYARAVNPNGPYKDACGEINVPVSLGNVVVEPGDIIVGDLDGLVAIHPGEACRVAEKAAEIADRAQKKIESIHRSGTMDLTWLHTKLDETGCRIR